MDKKNIKDNILRTCYHKYIYNGVGKEDFRNQMINDDLLDECCDELVDDGYLTCSNYLYKLTQDGIDFVLTSSFTVSDKPIVNICTANFLDK